MHRLTLLTVTAVLTLTSCATNSALIPTTPTPDVRSAKDSTNWLGMATQTVEGPPQTMPAPTVQVNTCGLFCRHKVLTGFAVAVVLGALVQLARGHSSKCQQSALVTYTDPANGRTYQQSECISPK